MRNVFILEHHIEGSKEDNRLFFWAKKIEGLGYEVSQIWESSDRYDCGCCDPDKGINFSMKNENNEGILLMLYSGCDDNADIRLEVDYDFLTQQGYIHLVDSLINERITL